MASKRIQGITVEIGGDTSKLTAALKDVDRSLSTTQGNLRDINKLLKLDPGNTELLAQKHRLLGDAVRETKERLETLKTAAQQANEALARGDITQNQYDALKREIIDTEQKLKNLENQANQSSVAIQKIGLAGSNLQSLGNSISNVGSSLMPISATVTGIGVAGLKVATDFEKAMSGVQAITGATGEEFEALRNTAIDLGATTAFSSGEVAEAMTEMAKAGWSTTQIIEGMAGVLDATAASGENLGSVATIVADAITGFGLEARDSARVADLLTQAANSGTIGITDLGESYKYVAPLAQSMGLSIEDVTTALSAMSMSGIKGSQAGTALRTVLTNMTKPTDTIANAMSDLGIVITNNDGSFKSLNEIVDMMRGSFSGLTDDQKAYYATALAGKEGMSGLLSLLNMTQEEYDALSQSMNDCTGIAGETAAVMQDNLQSKLEQLGGALESLAIKLADHVIPFLTQFVEHITKVVDAFGNLSPEVQKAILVIGGIVAAAGPVLVVVGKVISAIGTIMTIVPKLATAFGAVKTAFAALSAVFAANPIGLVIAAVAALIAIFITLWNNCEGFREFWINLWQGIKDFFVTIWEGIKSIFSGVIDFIKNNWQSMFLFLVNPVAGFFKLLWDNCEGFREFWLNLWDGIKDICSKAWEGIKSFTSKAWEGIKNGISSAWEGIKSGVSSAASAVTGFVKDSWSNIKASTTETWNNVKQGVSSAWENIKSGTSTALSNLKSNVSEAWSSIKSNTSEAWNNMKDNISSAWSSIKDGVSKASASVKETVSNAWSSIKENTSNLWNNIKDTVSNITSGIKDVVSNFSEGVKNLASNLWDNVKSTFDAGLNFVRNLMGNVLSGLLENVRGFFSNMISNAQNGLSQLQSGFSNAFNSIVSGVSNAVGNIRNALSGVFDAVRNVFSNIVSNAFSWGKDIIGNLISGITSKISSLVNSVKNVASTIWDYLHFSEPEKGPLSDFHTYMPDMIDLLGKGITDNLHNLKAPMTALGNALTPMTNGMQSVTDVGGSAEGNTKLDAMSDAITRYLPRMAESKIVLDSGVLVGELSDGINRQLGKAYV